MTRARFALALALAGCVNRDLTLYETTLELTVRAPAATPPGARLHLSFQHASRGEGAFVHPLGEFERRERALAPRLTETVLVPTSEGRGLVVYAWLDTDGDGQHCRPGGAREPSGLAVADAFPAHALALTLTLDATCAGPEALLP